jgi:hypothetical protein
MPVSVLLSRAEDWIISAPWWDGAQGHDGILSMEEAGQHAEMSPVLWKWHAASKWCTLVTLVSTPLPPLNACTIESCFHMTFQAKCDVLKALFRPT